MNNLVVVIVVVVLVVGILLAIRFKRNSRTMDRIVSDWCREFGVPDRPFNIEATVREVLFGTRPGIPLDGQWWIASGIEQIGTPSRTRLIHEGAVLNDTAVRANIDMLFDEYGGNAVMPPHLAEGRFLGSLDYGHPDIVYARITGAMRPLGAWLVAVPPPLIGSWGRARDIMNRLSEQGTPGD